MADRFANGDPTNDSRRLTGGPLVTGLDPTHKGFYHGGDIAGVTAQLDYIAGLGTTAIWLTPSFKNQPVQGTGANASAAYHGYWITDFTQIDPHLGTNEELEQLVDAAHARGIKVFFDIITNHTADVIDYAEGQHTYIDKATAPYLDAAGNEFDDRDFAGGSTFPELDAATSFPYTPVFRTPADATVKVPDWLNDPRYYHNRGDSTFAGESSEYGDFVGLDDLFTEQPAVVDGMSEIYRAWVDFGIDGFRIDTTKHVNIEFWQQFTDAIEEQAALDGNDDFFAFGEVFDTNPAFMSRYTTEGGLQATLDFGFQASATGFANGRPTTELRDFFASDDYYTDSDSNAYALPTFLGNHDMGRIGLFLRNGGASGDELLQRDRLAHALMYLSRGQPVVYYGDEQGFVGDGGDQDARQDMFPSQVATYNDDDLIGTDATTADDNFDPDHPLYRWIGELAALREAHPALADGAQLHRYASGRAGIYAFSRIDADEQREYVVAANNSEEPSTATFATSTPSQHVPRPVARGDAAQLRSDTEGRVTVTVPPLSVVVWRATAPVRASTRRAEHRSSARPGPGGIVGGRAEVGVSVPQPGFDQVTIAWRPAGAAAWTRARHRRQRALPRVPRRVRPPGRLAPRVPRRAPRRERHTSPSPRRTRRSAIRSPPGGGDPGGGGPVDQPDAVSVPGSLSSEMGCPGDWQPDCGPAQLTLDPDDQVWKGTYEHPPGRRLRVQGRHRPLVGRELRPRRRSRRCQHPARARRRAGDLLLRPRDALGDDR